MATEEEGGQPGFRWNNWKAWAALSTAQFAIILILAAGLAHLVIQQEGDDWPDEGVLSPLQRANRTIQVTAKRWESCRNHTRKLEANASNLTSQVTELNARLRLKELENKVLEDELALLKNWAQKLQDLINRQKEVIANLQEQQLLIRDSVDTHHQMYLHVALASMLITAIVTLQD
uniref:Uncharacterized protein n=1 Tax=Micrurus lemniscatus lemniscatus TaxID=129467 RepID=A0A2D4HG01_MICLE